MFIYKKKFQDESSVIRRAPKYLSGEGNLQELGQTSIEALFVSTCFIKHFKDLNNQCPSNIVPGS